MKSRGSTVIAGIARARAVLTIFAIVFGSLTVTAIVMPAFSRADGQGKESSKARATAVLSISLQAPKLLTSNRTNEPDFDSFRKSQAALLKSRTTLSAVLRDPKVAELKMVAELKDPLDWLEQAISTDFDLAPELMRVTVQGKPSQELVTLLNAVVKTYLEKFVDRDKNQRVARLDQLSELRNQFDSNLRAKRATLRKLSTMTGGDAILEPMLRQELLEFGKERARLRIAAIQLEVEHSKQSEDRKTNDAARVRLESDLKALRKQESLVNDEIQKRVQELLKRVPLAEELELIKRDVEATEAIEKKVAAEVQTLNVELQAPVRVRLVEPATLRADR